LPGSSSRAAVKVAAIYLVLAVLWILFSDQIVSFFAVDPALITRLQTAKGWMFVGVTALFIFFLLKREIATYQAVADHLRTSRQELRDILDAMPVGIALTDGTAIEYINVNFSERFGYILDEIPTDEQWFQLAYPDPAYRQQLIAGWRMELEKARASGGPIPPVEVNVTCKNGQTRQAIANTQLVGHRILIILTDITERELLQNELIKMQKLESIGVLAGGIAYDFNNILTGIMGNLSYAQLLLEPGHAAAKPLDAATNATVRAAELTRQLLTFARGGQPVKKVVSVQQLIHEAVTLLLRGTNVKGEVRVEDPVRAIEVDAGQITQVFNNIIINAVQAMPGGGTLRIAAGNVVLDNANTLALPEGDYVRITLTDEGCGIPPESLARIFDPYFSTKASGSGLGLASAYSIVTRHGGSISVDSAAGKGATFILHLPASAGQPTEPRPEGAGPQSADEQAGHLAVLVMDDEEVIRDIAATMLQFLGYAVQTCADGDAAVRLYGEALSEGAPFAVVLMDLTVPGGLGGIEAAKAIRALDPEARLVVSSGYSQDPIMSDYQLHGFNGVLAKPYKVAELGQVLQAVLAGRESR
jgi:signal transduction histidine kinase/ActR/RegA family two-component response regulator